MLKHDARDNVLIAFADPVRRAILERLARGEARVTDVAAPFAISLNSVSKHIRILERARLVRRRRVGREHLLRIDPRPIEDAAAWMHARTAQWSGRLERLARVLDSASPD
ncbi:metalloregulator ArsR/SmtB family transcription factor [Luteimonas sp. M1R5S18]|jgi:DNA-binding transcriptional ArsR family regulator|uniref:Metalloregulator ArsR/SmtB family transcription factor n=1 Tax=Luteimonas rhizosphaericola TaxID=3042024 RepID=A0ABT6JJJ4_9GAMM|nr:metalloregulator ArsR/SmtB family transcription factor [Luteimonas rhizosphaericola]MDH5830846.1 metalloregulator ArsR/SmtB family transcription factor [Luteimonas rhizosphaericola]